jgi:hypothetical protein
MLHAVITIRFVTNSWNLLVTYTHKKLWVWKLNLQPWNICVFSAVRTNWCFPFIVPHQLNRELNASLTQQCCNFSSGPLIITAVSNFKDKQLPLCPRRQIKWWRHQYGSLKGAYATRPEYSVIGNLITDLNVCDPTAGVTASHDHACPVLSEACILCHSLLVSRAIEQ